MKLRGLVEKIMFILVLCVGDQNGSGISALWLGA